GADAVTLSGGNVVVAALAAAVTGAEEMDINLAAGADTLTAGGNASANTGSLILTVPSGETLSMGSASTLPDFTDLTVATGGTFSLNGQNQTIDTLSGGGIVQNANATAATLTVGQNNSTFSFSGALQNGTGG